MNNLRVFNPHRRYDPHRPYHRILLISLALHMVVGNNPTARELVGYQTCCHANIEK